MTRFLAACRYLLVVPIVGCVLLTAGIVFMGMARIVAAGAQLVREGDSLCGSRQDDVAGSH